MRRVSLGSGSLLLHELGESIENDRRYLVDWPDVFHSRAVHELLFDPTCSGPPAFVAMSVAQQHVNNRPFVWIDPFSIFYPPAIAPHVRHLHLLHPRTSDLAWAAAECLRCKHIGAVVAAIPNRLTRVEVRRLQLAAEQGNSLGILLRPNLASAGSHIYSAASRWLISPAPGERTIQRWRVEHIHGHGRQFAPSFIVEKNRATQQTHFVHLPAALANHPKIAADFGEQSRAARGEQSRAAS